MDEQDIFILGIETSCDDTCAAVLKNGKVVSNIIKSQYSHKKYGGVVPELASREHLKNITKVVNEALSIAQITKENLSAISFTQTPGLIGPLFVGSMFAKGLFFNINKPLIAVNHMYGHALACFLEEEKPDFPYLCLLVSGGHTQIVQVNTYESIELLGETLDDAVGEAYDKIAKMIGFTYPGGPLIDKYAHEGDATAFKFPKTNIDNLNFSFSGIKTAFRIFLDKNIKQNENFISDNLENICASIQNYLLKTLIDKLEIAINVTKIKNIAIGGGVASNLGLREKLTQLASEKQLKVFFPQRQYCTDNAAMIAFCGYQKFLKKDFANFDVDVYS